MTTIPVVYVKGQYNHLIARRLQELGVDSHLVPPSTPLEKFEAMGADGLVMGGGPQSVRSLDSLSDELRDASNLMTKTKLPMLCICVTHQLMATTFGGRTNLARKPEFGPIEVSVLDEDTILEGLKPSFTAWESHNDEVVSVPSGFRVLAGSDNCAVQAMRHEKMDVFGVQFHPEVYHTPKGVDVFKNFLKVIRGQ
ncbi:MAG TPA: GMP synthase subunit A [Candidatus Angelobacter sp.]|nr:GMP synthase subunit A [Candidatus Angelobacter sp.]